MSTRKLKVLVIDDDVSVADTLVMVLNFSGFHAVAAYSGEDALKLANQALYDHLVTDVMMEPMNGIQAAIAIRAVCPGCTVLLISGNPRTSHLLTEAVRDGHEFEILAIACAVDPLQFLPPNRSLKRTLARHAFRIWTLGTGGLRSPSHKSRF